MPIIERQVVASSDDCYRRLTTSIWSLTSWDQQTGAWTATLYQLGGGMQFTNITIPQGATIVSAYLTFRCSLGYTGTVVKSKISAEDVDNAPTFADDAAAFDNRWANRTAARVYWDNIPVWTADVDYNSPEIKTVIQEVIDRGGWNSGQAIVIFWEDYEDRSTHTAKCCRFAYSYNRDAAYAPKLVIEYTVPLTERTFVDGIQVGEALVKNPILILADGIALTDVLVKNSIKALADGIALADAWEGYKLRVWEFIDSIAFTDTLVKGTSKLVTDGIAFTDTLVKSTIKVITDSIAIGEALVKLTDRTLTDAIVLRDVLIKSTAKVLIDGIAFTDELIKLWVQKVLRVLRAVRNLPSVREDDRKR